jgi:signal transduction histidine kinase
VSFDRTSGRTAGARRVGGGAKADARTAARFAWSITALAISSGVLFLVLLALNSRDPDVVTYEYWGAQAVTAIVFPAVGALIVSRHPRNTLGWLFCLMGLSSGLSGLALEYAVHALVVRPDSLPGATTAAWLDTWVGMPGFVSFALIPLLFPDGRSPSRRWQPIVWIAAGAIVVGMVSFALVPGPLEGYSSVDNPFGIEEAKGILELVLSVGALVIVVTLFAGLASLLVRYRRSRGAERQQLKWFTYAVAMVPLALLGNNLFPDLSWLIGGVGVACIPVAIGIAVLKYRLYDIDLVINRTLVYGTLTACVVGVYVLVVGYLGALFQTGGNLTISLVATGIVAVLFAPLRGRLQRAVNRLMYGERDEPYAAVSRLGERLGTALEPDTVLPTIVETVREALKLPYAAIALPRDGAFEVAAAFGEEPPAESLVLPLQYGGETVGRLLLGPRAGEGGFSAADQRLLDDLARHTGVAVHGVRVMADLRRSREGLVLAREEERRRLRRDLHDELAPTLAALGLRAATVGELIPADPKEAASANEKLRNAIRATVGDVRRLVYDLRPPALDDLGLVEAVRERASRLEAGEGLRVTVEAPDGEALPALPAAVEVAAYRIAQEALTNVSRHARASTCNVRISHPDARSLTVEVTDDGVGLPDESGGGVGLHSMRERAAELGGNCEISPASPSGTRVLARLPIEASVKSDIPKAEPNA